MRSLRGGQARSFSVRFRSPAEPPAPDRLAGMATPWDRAAAGYLDEWVPRFVPYHLDLVRELALHPGARVLVVSAGPGSEVLALARAVGNEGSVRATDKSEEMVRICREQVKTAGFANVETRGGRRRRGERRPVGRDRVRVRALADRRSWAPPARLGRGAGAEREDRRPHVGARPTARARSRSSPRAWARSSPRPTCRARACLRSGNRWRCCSTKGGSPWSATPSCATRSRSRARRTSSAR